MKIGIFDHVSRHLGGSQLVVAHMAAQLSRRHSVDVIHSGEGYTLSRLAAAFSVDLSRTKERIVENSLGTFSLPGSRSTWNYLRERLRADRALTAPYDLFIYSGHGAPPFCYARRGLISCYFPFEAHPRHDLKLTNGWHNRHLLDRWVRTAFYTAIWNRRMQGYQTVLGCSQFTCDWIQRFWHRRANVLYPPVTVEVRDAKKRNIIVSLGRFIDCDGKNHALQLEAFREFFGRVGHDWKLFMIGFCSDLPRDKAYVEKLREIAKDLPVTFVVNAERKQIFAYLAEAKLFWHTTALDNQSGSNPASTEHFGIATVEAMLAGCVPIVPQSGGQVEIVEHEVSGVLCSNLIELIHYSTRLAKDESLRANMSRCAKERARAFRPEVFELRFDQFVRHCLRGDSRESRGHQEQPDSSLAST